MGVPSATTSACASEARPQRHDERVAGDRVVELADERRRRDAQEDREHGQREEREAQRGENGKRRLHGRPNPAASSAARPRVESTSRTNRAAS